MSSTNVTNFFFTDTLVPDDLVVLTNELHEVRAEWYALGVQLRMKTSDLDAIETQYLNNTNRCLQRMLSVWLSRTDPSPPTLQNVVDALTSRVINRRDVAQRIRELFSNQNNALSLSLSVSVSSSQTPATSSQPGLSSPLHGNDSPRFRLCFLF